jgi:hypothetical protein
VFFEEADVSEQAATPMASAGTASRAALLWKTCERIDLSLD